MQHEPCQSSDIQAASGVILAGPCIVYGVTLIQAAAAATAIIYDNASAGSGKIAMQVNTTVNVSTNTTPPLGTGVICNKGAYLALTGTGATAVVYYRAI